MPLTDYQANLTRLLSENRTFDSYPARDAAILIEPNTTGYVRAVVRRDGNATKVEWADDSAWRFMPTIRDDRVDFVLGALCWAAFGKDPCSTPLSLLELLRRRGRVREEDLNRLDLVEPIDLHDLKRSGVSTTTPRDRNSSILEKSPTQCPTLADPAACCLASSTRYRPVEIPRGRRNERPRSTPPRT